MERNIKLTLQYDGSQYHGFQRQDNAVAIQQVVEERLAKIFDHSICLYASGRTDTGVHALGQVVNFYTTGSIPTDRIVQAANGILPADIVVVDAVEEAQSFHARKSARKKTYWYRIHNTLMPNPFERNYAWHVTRRLDPESMNSAAKEIIGTFDFSAFRGAGGPPVNPVKTLFDARCWRDDQKIVFAFSGSGFLYHMVRNLVGTLVEIGAGRRPVSEFTAILESRDRKLAGVTAPPQGLYLMRVEY